MSHKFDYFISLLLGILFLFLWEFLTHFMQISALVLPSPSSIFLTLTKGLSSGYFLPHLLQTLGEVLGGLLLGSIFGMGGGIFLGEVISFRKLVMPYVVMTQIIPKLALAPLFIVWFGFGSLPCVVMTALICFFPMLETTMTAIDNVDVQKIKLFKILGASRFQTLIKLKVACSLPYIFSGFRVSVVLSLVGAVVSEFIGASRGLGTLIIVGQGSMDTPMIFASMTLITAMGLCIYTLTTLLESYFLKNYALNRRR
jgi:NitT/TauT family transport system permease protein